MNNFLSETLTNLFTTGGFNYPTVMRYDFVVISVSYSGLFTVAWNGYEYIGFSVSHSGLFTVAWDPPFPTLLINILKGSLEIRTLPLFTSVQVGSFSIVAYSVYFQMICRMSLYAHFLRRYLHQHIKITKQICTRKALQS